MDTWEIIFAIVIVGLSIIMPIYYSSEKKKNEQLKELEKIKKYSETMKKFTRNYNNFRFIINYFTLPSSWSKRTYRRYGKFF